MKSITSLLVLLVAIISAIAAYHFSDSQVKKRATLAALEKFSESVATHDRAKISAELGELLSDDAKIRLDIHFFSIGNPKADIGQDFDKTQFINFIDNILYSMSDYDYKPQLQSLEKNNNQENDNQVSNNQVSNNLVNSETRIVKFTSVEWADGVNMLGGTAINMRYSSSSECEGIVLFAAEKLQLKKLNCRVSFRQVPKPGQEGKFLNKNNVMDLLAK